ncbi:hypothetical protein Nos7107_3296 [Nostoc sp. PCC 7107]|nr:hypothetical protein Nos7107_3296 [Nostoc sp. PCC 7107]
MYNYSVIRVFIDDTHVFIWLAEIVDILENTDNVFVF